MKNLFNQAKLKKPSTVKPAGDCVGYCLFWCEGYCQGYCKGQCKGYNRA